MLITKFTYEKVIVLHLMETRDVSNMIESLCSQYAYPSIY